VWIIEWDDRAVKELRKIDKVMQSAILKYLKKVMTSDNPKICGKPLVGSKKGFWRYRVGDYRLICSIEEDIFTVLILAVGHRNSIYE
jgi:mRNA interferase RelE/StbE